MTSRIDRATRVVAAPRASVWAAFADPEAMADWLPPEGMTGTFEAFDLRDGGRYRLVLRHVSGAGAGKTTADTDVAEGRFVEVRPPSRLVMASRFDSPDPTFAGEMRVIWTLALHPDGTEVTVAAEDVPPGISEENHAAGLASSLANLARHVGG